MTAENASQNGVGKHTKKSKHTKHTADDQTVVEHDTTYVLLPKTLSRVHSIPIVHEGTTLIHGIVSSHGLGRFALSTASTTLSTVNKYTQSYHKHFESLDDFGTKQVDTFVQTFPVVNKPAGELYDVVKAPPLKIYDGVKSKITVPASSLAKTVNDRLSVVVDSLESAVDYWLPAEGEPAHADESNQATRVYRLSIDASYRLINRVNVELEKNNIPRSTQELVEFARVNEFMNVIYVKVQELNDAVVSRIPPTVTQRVTDLTVTTQVYYTSLHDSTVAHYHHLSAELKKHVHGLIEYIKLHTPTLPHFIQQRLEPLVNFLHRELEIVQNQASRTDVATLEKAREIVRLTKEEFLPILHSSVTDVHEQFKKYTVRAYEVRSHVFGSSTTTTTTPTTETN